MNDPSLVDRIIEDLPEIVTVDEIAEVLRVENPTVRRWIRDGHLHGIRLGQRLVRVYKDDLRAFLLKADEHGLQ